MFVLPKPEIIAKPVQPDAAVAFWQARAAMTREQAMALPERERWRAFYIAGLSRLDQVQLVKDAFEKALSEGGTIRTFEKDIASVMQSAGWGSHRVETIFRTNMQTAYAAGRYAKMQAVKATRPYWQYITVEDKRRRPSHAVLHGLVFLADHEFWASNYPPNGFRCRCAVRTLSERQMIREGLTAQTEIPRDRLYTDPITGMEYHVAMPGADKGFANNPGKDWMAGLDMEKHPDSTPKTYEEVRGKSIIKPVASNEELAKQIHEHVSPFTANGPVRNVTFDRGEYFMATSSQGHFWISQREFPTPDGPFNPAEKLKSAWNKMATGKPLDFQEEYSVESLWHETVHNRQTPTSAGGEKTVSRRMMETVTQWVARRTYPKFMETLGGKAEHQAKVLKDGYGYKHYIRNFDRLLEVLGVEDGPEALAYFEELCRTADRKKYQKAIADYLVKHASKPVKKSDINEILKQTDVWESNFEILLRRSALVS